MDIFEIKQLLLGDENFPVLTVLLLIMTLIIIIVTYALKPTISADMPPGPTPIPLVGSAHLFIGRKDEDVYRTLTDKYGDVFALRYGSTTLVVLNSHETITDALKTKGDACSYRPVTSYRKFGIFPFNSGILGSEGSIWKSHRRFCMRHLRDLGLGRQSSETRILGEIEIFLSRLHKECNRPFEIQRLLSNAVSNIICQMIFGKRYEYDDEEFSNLLRLLEDLVATPYALLMLDPSSLTRFLFMRRFTEENNRNWATVLTIVRKHMDEHEAMFDKEKTTGDDLINMYLCGRQGVFDTEKSPIDETIFEVEQIQTVILDCFSAGTETTATALRWALLYMIRFPDVQQKVRAEIYEVIGRERAPSFADKDLLPYTQAVITETLRTGNIAYMSLPHRTSRDVELCGYLIPGNTVIVPNLTAVHMNEKVFPNPRVFRPERFLDASGKINKVLADRTVPFGIGKRLCLGKALAEMELFLFFTGMIQRFEFKIPDGAPVPSLEGNAQFINSPEPFVMNITSL